MVPIGTDLNIAYFEDETTTSDRDERRELWRLWRDQFDDDQVALAEAIWAANKMVKTESPQTRDRFCALKDEFILRYATNG